MLLMGSEKQWNRRSWHLTEQLTDPSPEPEFKYAVFWNFLSICANFVVFWIWKVNLGRNIVSIVTFSNTSQWISLENLIRVVSLLPLPCLPTSPLGFYHITLFFGIFCDWGLHGGNILFCLWAACPLVFCWRPIQFPSHRTLREDSLVLRLS